MEDEELRMEDGGWKQVEYCNSCKYNLQGTEIKD